MTLILWSTQNELNLLPSFGKNSLCLKESILFLIYFKIKTY